jgi:hypothetical protein
MNDALERLRRMRSRYRGQLSELTPLVPDDDDDADEPPAVSVPANDPLLAALRRERGGDKE